MKEKTSKYKEFQNKVIIFVTPELKTFKARAGGLGPAVEELAYSLAKLGAKIFVISPLYHAIQKDTYRVEIDYEEMELKDVGQIEFIVAHERALTKIKKIEKKDVTFYFLDNQKFADAIYMGDLFKLAIFLGRGTLEILKNEKIKPDIIHMHDALSSLAGFFAKYDPKFAKFRDVKLVYTIHNAGMAYQQIFGKERLNELDLEKFDESKIIWNGNINLTYCGTIIADRVNTVSKDYEITLKTLGEGMKEVFVKKNIIGIINGIDVEYWQDPIYRNIKNKDELLEAKKKKKRELIEEIRKRVGKKLDINKMIIIMPRRIADQKGFDRVIPIMPKCMKECKIQFIALGISHPNDQLGHQIANQFKDLHNKYKEMAFIYDFDEELAKKMYAGGDAILYPSLPNKEPCGTGYMMAMVNGTPCIGTATGGLIEVIENFDWVSKEGNGILIWKEEYGSEAFMRKIRIASKLYYEYKEIWKELVWNAFKTNVDINEIAKIYVKKVYIPLIKGNYKISL